MHQRAYANGAIKVERIVVKGRVLWGYEATYGAVVRSGERSSKSAAICAAKSAVEELANVSRLNRPKRLL